MDGSDVHPSAQRSASNEEPPEWLAAAEIIAEIRTPNKSLLDERRSALDEAAGPSTISHSVEAAHAMTRLQIGAAASDASPLLESRRREALKELQCRELEAKLEEEREARRRSEIHLEQERKAGAMLEASHRLLSTMLQHSTANANASPPAPPPPPTPTPSWRTPPTRVAAAPAGRAEASAASSSHDSPSQLDESSPVAEPPPSVPLVDLDRAFHIARSVHADADAEMRRRVLRLIWPLPVPAALAQTSSARRATASNLAAMAHESNRSGQWSAAASGFERSHAWLPSSVQIVSCLNMHLKSGDGGARVALLGYWRLLEREGGGADNETTVGGAMEAEGLPVRLTPEQKSMVQRKFVAAAEEVVAEKRRRREAAVAERARVAAGSYEAVVAAANEPTPHSPTPPPPQLQQQPLPPRPQLVAMHSDPFIQREIIAQQQAAAITRQQATRQQPVEVEAPPPPQATTASDGSTTLYLLALWVVVAAWMLREALLR